MKTALITGVGRGIGKALAQRFLAEGWDVIGTSQTGQADYSDPNLKVIELDLTSPESIATCAAALNALAASSQKPTILINNAGVLEDDEETHVIIDKLRRTLEVNLIGTIDWTERVISSLDTESHIVNISSQAGSLADAANVADSHYPYHYPAYKISKAALNMYTRTLANRLRHEDTKIIVSSVHPGWVRTGIGGTEAPTSPEEAAEKIYKLAISRPETGQFWFNGEKYPW